MKVKSFTTRISPKTIARIDAMAGRYRRAKFVRDAAEAELLRREASAASHDKPKPRKGRPA
jgi:predicted transcriptional regulator